MLEDEAVRLLRGVGDLKLLEVVYLVKAVVWEHDDEYILVEALDLSAGLLFGQLLALVFIVLIDDDLLQLQTQVLLLWVLYDLLN